MSYKINELSNGALAFAIKDAKKVLALLEKEERKRQRRKGQKTLKQKREEYRKKPQPLIRKMVVEER